MGEESGVSWFFVTSSFKVWPQKESQESENAKRILTSKEAPFSLKTLRAGPHSGAPLKTGTMWVPESTYC